MASLLVSIAAPRLRSAGIHVPGPFPDAEHRLYALLIAENPARSHARYNALIRRLVSYERSLGFRYPAVDPADFRNAVEEAIREAEAGGGAADPG